MNRKELSAHLGLSDLKTTKDMLLRKRFDGVPATEEEEKLLDFMNRKVIHLLLQLLQDDLRRQLGFYFGC